jgi:hypothetical protein
MADIGTDVKTIEFEPLPESAPLEEEPEIEPSPEVEPEAVPA